MSDLKLKFDEDISDSIALRESEENYRALVEDMPALVCRFLPNGTLTFVNNSYCRYFNKTRDELLGADFFQFIPAEEREEVRKQYRSLTQESPAINYEHQVYTKVHRSEYLLETNGIGTSEHIHRYN